MQIIIHNKDNAIKVIHVFMSHSKMQISFLSLLNNLGMKGLKKNEVKIRQFK